MVEKKRQKESTNLEILVAKIQQSLAPDAAIEHNAKVRGRRSKVERQIDVLMKQNIGQLSMTIAIECKDLSSPADVKVIDGFHTVIDDIAAHKGILVCPSGFTKAAKEMAKSYQIELYSPVDTEPHKWTVKPFLPAIFDFIDAGIAFGISQSEPLPFKIPYDFFNLTVYDEDGNEIGNTWECTIKKWNEGAFPTEVGVHDNINVFGDQITKIDNGYGQLTRVKLYISLHVRSTLFLGELPISEISGFRDEQTGDVITNAFTTGLISPEEVEKNWKKVGSIEDAPIKPFMILQGLVGWPI